MFSEIPAWFKILLVVFLIFGVGAMTITLQKCGWKALFLGNGASAAAMMGLCD